jgi:hypothetical protein
VVDWEIREMSQEIFSNLQLLQMKGRSNLVGVPLAQAPLQTLGNFFSS